MHRRNLGGIANCTLLCAKTGSVIAFDSGPANMILDFLVQTYQGRLGPMSENAGSSMQYDDGGKIAAKGTVIAPLLKEALSLEYFRKKPPKSTGHELFGSQFVRWFVDHADQASVSTACRSSLEDLLATATELTARSIADAYQEFLFPKITSFPVEVIISGGGWKNTFLMQRLTALLPQANFVPSSSPKHIPPDAKEAVGFAILAYFTLKGMPNNICTATGATEPAVLGKIALGDNSLRKMRERQSSLFDII
mmetsp:Transcript_30721/g.51710  ORF Transcript_30721/g.51710 Transcript_30721/m.51710 type:complete len:252 (+) Transcript_30721:587-1342(+)